MQLSVSVLRETCTHGIELAQSAQKDWDKNVDAAEAAWEEQWRKIGIERWRPLRDKISKCLRTGGHITTADMPFSIDRYSDDPIGKAVYRPFNRGRIKDNYNNSFVADHDFGPRPVLKIRGFEALIDFLGAVTDKTISTSQLERAGFRNMHKLFEAAANGAWE